MIQARDALVSRIVKDTVKLAVAEKVDRITVEEIMAAVESFRKDANEENSTKLSRMYGKILDIKYHADLFEI